MYDNICKFLAETFPTDVANWLLGTSVKLTQLSPTELSLEPIRADSLILQQSEEIETGKLERVLGDHEGFVYCLAFSPNGQTLVSGSWDRKVNIWHFAR